MLTTKLQPGSGISRHTVEISKRLVKRGHDVTVFAREVNLHPEDLKVNEVRFVGSKRLIWIRNLVTVLKGFSMLRGFDIIHSQYYPVILCGSLKRLLQGTPHVFTFHGVTDVRFWRSFKRRCDMLNAKLGIFLGLRVVDKVIAVSEYLKRVLTNDFGARNIVVIPNGVDTECFNPKVSGDEMRRKLKLESTPTVLYVGRVVPHKGLQYLVQAMPLVLRELPETKFVIAGEEKENGQEIKKLVGRMGVGSSVTFTGYVPEEDLPRIYNACDVFCSPSLWEGFGMPFIEASACGKPCVGFRTRAVPEVINDQKTGLLVDPGDIKHLAEALITILSDRSLAKRMGARAVERVKKLYSWESIVDRVLEVYYSLV